MKFIPYPVVPEEVEHIAKAFDEYIAVVKKELKIGDYEPIKDLV
jgi:hypothetical protein